MFPYWAAVWTVGLIVVVATLGASHLYAQPRPRTEVRSPTGKSAGGRIELSASFDGELLVIEVADDGKGIDWARVAENIGASAGTKLDPPELVEAPFVDGVSTADSVSDVADRGIGQGAVRAACAANSGTIHVTSRPGQGTRVRMEFPRTSEMVASALRIVGAA